MYREIWGEIWYKERSQHVDKLQGYAVMPLEGVMALELGLQNSSFEKCLEGF
jgi:hypothetical protein